MSERTELHNAATMYIQLSHVLNPRTAQYAEIQSACSFSFHNVPCMS